METFAYALGAVAIFLAGGLCGGLVVTLVFLRKADAELSNPEITP